MTNHLLLRHNRHLVTSLFLAVWLLPFLTSSSCAEDFLIMKNGDRLTGTITAMTPATLTIELPYAGATEIDRAEISEIQIETPCRFMLSDKTIILGNLSKKKDGPATVHDSITGDSEQLAFSDVAYMNPPPHISGEGTAFTGEVNFGGELKEGNTVSTKLRIDLESQYDRGIQRYLFNGNAQWESKNRENTEDNWFLQARSNRLFAPKWYTLGNLSLEYDKFKGLKLRSVTGGGVGYRFIDEEHDKVSLEGGPNYVYENYKQTGKSYALAFREGFNLQFGLFTNRIFLYHHHSVLQGLSNTDILAIRTTTGMKVPLGILDIHTALELNWTWDKTPSPGRQKSDTTVNIKAGYGW